MTDYKSDVIEAFRRAIRDELPNIIEMATIAVVVDSASDMAQRYVVAAAIKIHNLSGVKITDDMIDEITRELFEEIKAGVQSIINSVRAGRN